MRLKNKVALVTGGGRGLGRAMALAFAKEGANVIINEINIEASERVSGEVKKLGCQSLSIQADIANKTEVVEMVKTILKKFGKIEILVNNAGINMVAPSVELEEDGWDRALNINLKGVFLCSQAVAKEMIKQKRGNIINIASIYGLFGVPERAAYCASKAAVVSLTQTLASEWARYNINVNAIAPGLTRTDMVQDLINRGIFDEKGISGRSPAGRLGEPDDIANAAVFLATDESRYITGHTLVVDGGWSAYGYLQSWLDGTKK